jgi:L-alanine-DL-glutamate epimerase-like enolase superfamily enzyme
MAVAPSIRYLEFHGHDVDFWDSLVTVPPIVGGQAPVPDAPGLGVELNYDALAHFAVPGELFFGEDVKK